MRKETRTVKKETGWRGTAAYGIDAGPAWVVVARSVHGRKPELLFEGPSWPVGLADRMDREAARGRAVTSAALPADEGLVRWLPFPFPSLAKARRVLPSLLDVQLPFPLDECISRTALWRRGEGRARALVLAARTAAVRDRLDELAAAGTDPMILDHEGLALWEQGLDEQPLGGRGARVEVFLGQDHTVAVLGRDGEVISVHHARIGRRLAGGGENREKAEVLAARLLRIARTLSGPDTGPVAWFWSGPGAADRDLVAFLEKELRTGLPLQFQVHREPGWLLARALSERAVRGAGPRCNLRSGDFRHPFLVRSEQRQHQSTAAAYLALGLGLVLLNAAWLGALRSRERQVERRIAERAAEVAGFTVPRGEEVLVTGRAVADEEPAYDPFLRAFQPSLSSLLAALLSEARGRHMILEALALGPEQAAIQGRSVDWDDCEALAGLLRAGGYPVEAPVRTEAGADERVRFSLSGGIAR